MAKKSPIPKKLAGVKVPKSLRKSKLLQSLLGSPMGRNIVADALVAGAAAAAAALVREREEIADTAKAGARRGTRTLSLVGETIQDGANAIMGVIADAAQKAVPERRVKDRAGKAGVSEGTVTR